MIMGEFNAQCTLMHHVISRDIKNKRISTNIILYHDYKETIIKRECLVSKELRRFKDQHQQEQSDLC